MSNFVLPRRDSSPYLALNALNNLGGEATTQAIMKVRNWRGRSKLFQDEVIARLARCLLIDVLGDMCVITQAGRKYLGIKVEEANGFVGEPAGPRYVPERRVLNRAKHFPPRPQRPGADDYRSIPSVMGGQRIEYR